MALLTAQQVTLTGLDISFASASAGGDTAACADRTVLLVRNASGSAVTVTIATPGTVSGLAIADVTHSVPDGTTAALPLYPASLLGDTSGVATITYSAATSVTVAAVRV